MTATLNTLSHGFINHRYAQGCFGRQSSEGPLKTSAPSIYAATQESNLSKVLRVLKSSMRPRFYAATSIHQIHSTASALMQT